MYDFSSEYEYFKVLFNDGTGKRFSSLENAVEFGVESKRAFRIVKRTDFCRWSEVHYGKGYGGAWSPLANPVTVEKGDRSPGDKNNRPMKTRGWITGDCIEIEVSDDGGKTWKKDRTVPLAKEKS